jgi:hypothetical protein
LSWILIAVLALLIVLLSVPFHFGFQGEYAEALNFQGRVAWAGGLISFLMVRKEGKTHLSYGILGFIKEVPATEKKDSWQKRTSAKKGVVDYLGNLSLYLNRQIFAVVKVLLKRLRGALHLHLNLSGIYGFDDPSLTGMMMGAIAALGIRNNTVNIDPDFTGAVIDIKGNFRGWFVPLHILAIIVIFLFKKPIRAIWRPKINFRKKQKEVFKHA